MDIYMDENLQVVINEEAKMTIYNALPRKEYERVFMCKTAKEVWHTLIITHQGNSQVKNCMIDLLTQEYEKFSISNKETIDSGFTRFNAIATSLKSLDPNYSKAKYLATLPLDEPTGNLKVYEMVLYNDGVSSKTTKENVKSLAFKAKVTRVQTSDDSDSQGGSDEDIDEEEAEAFNLFSRNFRKGGESSKPKRACYNFRIEGHFASECRNLKENKTDREDGNEQPNDATSLMAINSQENFTKTFEKLLKEKRALEDKNSKLLSKINDLEIEVKKLANKEVVKPCLKYVELTQEVDSLTSNVSKLQDEALKFSKFKSSSIALDDMLSRQKLS
ncbi:hypothetical protein Tco_1487706 [Tanacetum coccineum]